MRIHPRERLVTHAQVTIERAILDATRDLTEAEIVQAVAGALGGYLGRFARHLIRLERHGNPDTPGGLAGD